MSEIQSYMLKPTRLVPNSPHPLIHYSGFFNNESASNPVKIHEHLASKDWQTQWIIRYGPTQQSHYHSTTHECMVVLSGSATIRFGVADIAPENACGSGDDSKEPGGIEIQANVGDAFLIPAGVAHKTFDPTPMSTFQLLTPGNGHGIDDVDVQKALSDVKLSGFTMMGAYPSDAVWDFSEGGDHIGHFEKIWAVPKPALDPILGEASEAMCGLWS